MDKQNVIKLFDQAVIPNYIRKPIVFTRGRGMWVSDTEGNHYLDFFSGWAVTNVGHCHPKLVKAVQDQAAELMYMPNIFYWPTQGQLAARISKATGWDGQCFFCNSGAESVEGAIKLARLATAPGKSKIITFKRGFHGRTLATLTATAQPKYQDGVGPLPAGFDYAEFNNLNSVKELMDDETAAIIVEPIQGEGGIHPATRNFLEGLRELCDEHGAVLVFDEVWTGVGRTGKWFAHQHYNVRPDIMTLAKGIGGGAVLAAVVATPETAKRLTPGMHASTFGGSPLATAAGNAVFEIIEEESLLGNATVRGKQLLDGLEAMEKKSDLIKQVRGLGLMAGVQLSVPGAKVVEAALQHGLLINCTQETIIRFAPALTVTEDEVNEGLNRFARALRDAVEG